MKMNLYLPTEYCEKFKNIIGFWYIFSLNYKLVLCNSIILYNSIKESNKSLSIWWPWGISFLIWSPSKETNSVNWLNRRFSKSRTKTPTPFWKIRSCPEPRQCSLQLQCLIMPTTFASTLWVPSSDEGCLY